MAGKIYKLIEAIVEERSGGNKLAAHFTRAKLALKGIDPNQYTAISPDDPVVIQKLNDVAKELGLKLDGGLHL